MGNEIERLNVDAGRRGRMRRLATSARPTSQGGSAVRKLSSILLPRRLKMEALRQPRP
jgi:hypothetical protein